MVWVKIAGVERRLEEVEESWINQRINRARAAGEAVCVIVRIETPAANVRLSTPGCAGGGGGRPPNADERKIIELWQKHGLNAAGFTGGHLIAFLTQLRRVL